ncbi:MAG: DUF3090 domain-containing protein [Anaerolineales bacterium]|nr:DUF3090 domain-containing protein [Anaerolineales bacterium]
MPNQEFDLNPVDHITVDALGPAGDRVFYIQAQKGAQTITLIAEKFQLQSLAIGIERFLAEIAEKFPDLPAPVAEFSETQMHIHPPVDPLCRIANIGLGFDIEADLAVLVIHELLPEGDIMEEIEDAIQSDDDTLEGDVPNVVRLWCSRDQLLALSRWSIEVASRGRPICPQCNEPMEPEGHFCVKKNGGHARK